MVIYQESKNQKNNRYNYHLKNEHRQRSKTEIFSLSIGRR